MPSDLSKKWQAVGTRCSVYASCLCTAIVILSSFCPPYAFGMTDDEVAAGIGAAGLFAILLSVANAVLAVGMMIRFPDARDSPWLLGAVILPVFVIILTPAVQTA